MIFALNILTALNNMFDFFQCHLDLRPVAELGDDSRDELYAKEKLVEMLDFFETMATLYEQIQKIPTGTLAQIAKKGDAIRKLLGSSSSS